VRQPRFDPVAESGADASFQSSRWPKGRAFQTPSKQQPLTSPFFSSALPKKSFPKQGGRKNKPEKSSARLIFSFPLPENSFFYPKKSFSRLIFSSARLKK